jgi:hypothetical protein
MRMIFGFWGGVAPPEIWKQQRARSRMIFLIRGNAQHNAAADRREHAT